MQNEDHGGYERRYLCGVVSRGQSSPGLLQSYVAPYEPLVCDYIVDELHRKFREKFPDRVTELEAFLYNALSFIKVVPTPETAVMAEDKVRDPKDRPILRSALDAHADLFLTGDKDFLESSITDPRIISVAEFLGREE